VKLWIRLKRKTICLKTPIVSFFFDTMVWRLTQGNISNSVMEWADFNVPLDYAILRDGNKKLKTGSG